MLNNNSRLFHKHVMGMENNEEYEEEIDPVQFYDQKQQNLISALKPINFDEKVMGGMNSSMFLNGKLPYLDGSANYTQRVNMLTGKGVSKMEDKKIDIMGSSGTDGLEKIEKILGKSKGSFNIDSFLSMPKSQQNNVIDIFNKKGKDDAMLKINKILGNNQTSKKNVDYFNSGVKDNSMLKINNMLGNNQTSKKDFFKTPSFDIKTGLGKRAVTGFNPNLDVSKIVGMNIKNTKNIHKQNKDSALDKINNSFGILNTNKNHDSKINSMFKIFGNPEKQSKQRLKQQKGLSLFGDYDKDGVMNIFDCNPVDYFLQGEQHDLNRYMGNKDLMVRNSDVVVVPDKNITVIPPNDNIPINTRPDIFVQPGVLAGNYDGMGNTQFYDDEEFLPNMNVEFGDSGAEYNFDAGVGINETPSETGFSGTSEEDINNQLRVLLNKINNAKDYRERNAYAVTYQELLKTKRANDARKDAELKKELGLADIAAKRDISVRGLDIQEALNADKTDLSYAQLDKGERDDARKYALEREKMKLAQQSGDIALWEKKIRAGTNILGDLIGGGNSLKGFNQTVSNEVGVTSGRGISQMALMPTNSSGPIGLSMMSRGGSGNPQNMMLMAGGLGYSEPFERKTSMIVGQPSMEKSFAQKVNESIGRKTPEDVIKEEQISRENIMEVVPQQVVERPQPVQPQYRPQPVQPQYRPQPVQPQYRPQPVQQYSNAFPVSKDIDWSRLTPEQVSQIDPQYAKYMAESEGDNVYRRGPYKKTRY